MCSSLHQKKTSLDLSKFIRLSKNCSLPRKPQQWKSDTEQPKEMPHYVSDPQDSCQILTQHFRHSSKKFDHMVFPEKKKNLMMARLGQGTLTASSDN